MDATRYDPSQDFYELLGVDPSADPTEIGRAFRRKAVHLHPDKTDDPSAHRAFVQLSNACECLRDQESRIAYDATRLRYLQRTHLPSLVRSTSKDSVPIPNSNLSRFKPPATVHTRSKVDDPFSMDALHALFPNPRAAPFFDPGFQSELNRCRRFWAQMEAEQDAKRRETWTMLPTGAQPSSVHAPGNLKSVAVAPSRMTGSNVHDLLAPGEAQKLRMGSLFRIPTKSKSKSDTYSVWCSHDLTKLQWRKSGAKDIKPEGGLLIPSDFIRIMRRKGSQLSLLIETPNGRIELEALDSEAREFWYRLLRLVVFGENSTMEA